MILADIPQFIPDPFFGKILQALPARQIQFAVKFLFRKVAG